VLLSIGAVMRRRDFLKVITGSAAVWPLTAHAQQPIPAIGYLSAATLDDYTKPQIGAFRQGLKETRRGARPHDPIPLGGWPLRSIAGARS